MLQNPLNIDKSFVHIEMRFFGNGMRLNLFVDSNLLNRDRYGLDPNRGEVAVVEDPKRDVMVMDDIIAKRGEAMVW